MLREDGRKAYPLTETGSGKRGVELSLCLFRPLLDSKNCGLARRTGCPAGLCSRHVGRVQEWQVDMRISVCSSRALSPPARSKERQIGRVVVMLFCT